MQHRRHRIVEVQGPLHSPVATLPHDVRQKRLFRPRRRECRSWNGLSRRWEKTVGWSTRCSKAPKLIKEGQGSGTGSSNWGPVGTVPEIRRTIDECKFSTKNARRRPVCWKKRNNVSNGCVPSWWRRALHKAANSVSEVERLQKQVDELKAQLGQPTERPRSVQFPRCLPGRRTSPRGLKTGNGNCRTPSVLVLTMQCWRSVPSTTQERGCTR